MLPVRKSLVLLSVVASMALAAAGCGSSSSSTSSSEEGSGAVTGNATSALESPTTATSGRDGAAQSDGNGSTRPSSSSSGGVNPPSGGPDTNANGTRLGSDTSKTGDNSIQTYGSDAEGAEKAAAITAMRSFVLAIAARDYIKVCAALSSRIRAGLAQSGKRCPEILESLLIIPASKARRSANGTVTRVRVGGGNAFVLFRPAGSSQLNYFVMKLEDDEWKSLGLTVGEPLTPSGAPGQ